MTLFTKIARAKRALRTPTHRQTLRQRLHRPARGQVLPLVAGGMMAFVLFATLLIDGAMMMQARRDLEIIAEHAATSAAQEVNFNAFPASCPGTGSPVGCEGRFILNVTAARNEAFRVANSWINTNESQSLSLPGFDPTSGPFSGSNGIRTGGTNANRVVVEIARCYRPFLINIFTANNGDGCTNATSIQVRATARPVGGN